MLICALLHTTAYGDPPLRILSPSQCKTQAGSDYSIPPGYFLADPDWLKLDKEVKRLQESETRLKAENKVLADSLPKWFTVAGAAVAGFALGAYLL